MSPAVSKYAVELLGTDYSSACVVTPTSHTFGHHGNRDNASERDVGAVESTKLDLRQSSAFSVQPDIALCALDCLDTALHTSCLIKYMTRKLNISSSCILWYSDQMSIGLLWSFGVVISTSQ